MEGRHLSPAPEIAALLKKRVTRSIDNVHPSCARSLWLPISPKCTVGTRAFGRSDKRKSLCLELNYAMERVMGILTNRLCAGTCRYNCKMVRICGTTVGATTRLPNCKCGSRDLTMRNGDPLLFISRINQVNQRH